MFIFMFILVYFGCNLSLEPESEKDQIKKGGFGGIVYGTWYMGKAIVMTESGKPCKYAKVLTEEGQPDCLADTTGTVIVSYFRDIDFNPPENMVISCMIYKYHLSDRIKKREKIYLIKYKNWGEWDEENILKVVFPDSP